MHSRPVYGTLWTDRSGRRQSHHYTRIFVCIGEELLDRGAAACFINVAMRVTSICALMHPGMHFFVQIVIKVHSGELEKPFQCQQVKSGGSHRNYWSDVFITGEEGSWKNGK